MLKRVHRLMEDVYAKIKQDSTFMKTEEFVAMKFDVRKMISDYCAQSEKKPKGTGLSISTSDKPKKACTKLEDTGLW